MSLTHDRSAIKIRTLFRRMRRQDLHTKAVAGVLGELSNASTIILQRHFEATDGPDVAALIAARDKANQLLFDLEHS
jgi:hypothetical protein